MGSSTSRKACVNHEQPRNNSFSQDTPYAVVVSQNLISLPNLFRASQLSKVALGRSGLKNFGHTCGLNASVQCLSNCQPLSDYFCQNLHKRDVGNRLLGQDCTLTSLVAELIQFQWSKVVDYVSPKRLAETVSEAFKQVPQLDAGDVFVYLLDTMHKELTRSSVSRPLSFICSDSDELAAAQAWSQHLKHHESIITDLFTGMLKRVAECTNCGFTCAQYESFNHLNLPLASDKSMQLEECFDLLTQEELTQHPMNCTGCKSSQRMIRRIVLQRMPPVLVLRLQRFRYEQGLNLKQTAKVNFQLYGLNLKRWTRHASNQTPMYSLTGIIQHKGTPEQGHYIAACLSKASYSWAIFDDKRVQPIDFEAVANWQPDVLVYQMNKPEKFHQQSCSSPLQWPYKIEIGNETTGKAETPAVSGIAMVNTSSASNSQQFASERHLSQQPKPPLERRTQRSIYRGLSAEELMAKIAPPSLEFGK